MEKLNLKLVTINPTFYIVALGSIALGYGWQFLTLFILTTIHELSHILSALLFKCKVKKVRILPLGEIAEISEMERIPIIKKVIIIISGPLSNLLIALFVYTFFRENDSLNFVMNANFALCFFNLIPIFPLDGGRLLNILVGEAIGILNSIKIVIRISKFLSILLIIIGTLQIILYPYNISLLLIGTYILSVNKKEHISLTYSFFKSIEEKNISFDENKIYNVKTIIARENSDIKKIMRKINFNYYHIIHILNEDGIMKTITETKLIDHVLKNGISGTITEIDP